MPKLDTITPNALFSWGRCLAATVQATPFPPTGSPQATVAVMGIRNNTVSCSNTAAIVEGLRRGFRIGGRISVVPEKTPVTDCEDLDTLPPPQSINRRIRSARDFDADFMAVGILTETRSVTQKKPAASPEEKEKTACEPPPEVETQVTYSLAVEITDLKTGMVVLRKQRDHLERATTTEPAAGKSKKAKKAKKAEKAKKKERSEDTTPMCEPVPKTATKSPLGPSTPKGI